MPSTGYNPNYTLGRGELWFANFINPVTKTYGGERYFGNTPSFSASVENEELPHYNSDRGIREKDESISLQTDRTASFTTDHVSPENLALFFMGSSNSVSVAAATVDDEEIPGVIVGLTYQLGRTPTNPAGVRNLDAYTPGTANVILTNSAGTTTYVEGTDYIVDLTTGRLEIIPGSTVVSGSTIKVRYKTASASFERVISGSSPIEGALRFISYNPAGKQFDWFMPWVKVTPNGEFALKGDEWQTIPFSVEILKKPGEEAIYVDGRALLA